jgi:hypothetical protein
MAQKINLGESIKQITDILRWFDDQKEIDIEAGLEKVKTGLGLVKSCRSRLGEIENEFAEVEREMDQK